MKCKRSYCEHTFNQHNDLWECKKCKCGYFIMYDLMTQVELVVVWANRVPHYKNSGLYGWLRVFEGMRHFPAMKAAEGGK